MSCKSVSDGHRSQIFFSSFTKYVFSPWLIKTNHIKVGTSSKQRPNLSRSLYPPHLSRQLKQTKAIIKSVLQMRRAFSKISSGPVTTFSALIIQISLTRQPGTAAVMDKCNIVTTPMIYFSFLPGPRHFYLYVYFYVISKTRTIFTTF